MSEQTEQGQGQATPPVQFQAFVQRVAQVASEHGMQAVVIAAAVPAAGGFGPSTVHALSWTHGHPPAEWRKSAAAGLGEVAGKAAASLAVMPATPAAAAEVAAESVEAPAAAESAAPEAA